MAAGFQEHEVDSTTTRRNIQEFSYGGRLGGKQLLVFIFYNSFMAI
jgi:hypothetical protein